MKKPLLMLLIGFNGFSFAQTYFTQHRFHSDQELWAGYGDSYACSFGKSMMFRVSRALKEFVLINTHFVSLSTVKVLTAFIPPYLAARIIDEPIHRNFYTDCAHKNKNQLPKSFTKAVYSGGDVLIVGFSLPALFAKDCKLQNTSRIFALGAISGLFFKDLVKSIAKTKSNVRPFNECFPKKKTFGGFPSGHMIETSYIATVWGWQYGYKLGVPLTMFSALMFGVVINRNYHFASQAVAGAAVGIAYGIAANRLIDHAVADYCTIGMSSDGSPYMKVTLPF